MSYRAFPLTIVLPVVFWDTESDKPPRCLLVFQISKARYHVFACAGNLGKDSSGYAPASLPNVFTWRAGQHRQSCVVGATLNLELTSSTGSAARTSSPLDKVTVGQGKASHPSIECHPLGYRVTRHWLSFFPSCWQLSAPPRLSQPGSRRCGCPNTA